MAGAHLGGHVVVGDAMGGSVHEVERGGEGGGGGGGG